MYNHENGIEWFLDLQYSVNTRMFYSDVEKIAHAKNEKQVCYKGDFNTIFKPNQTILEGMDVLLPTNYTFLQCLSSKIHNKRSNEIKKYIHIYMN